MSIHSPHPCPAPSLAERSPGTRRLLRLGVSALLFLSPVSAWAEYRVQAGDVVEISVAGVPDLQRRVSVRPDGSISFPLMGTVSVAGLSLSQLQAKVQTSLATKVFPQRTSDGRELDIVIDPEVVIANVVEYRPIYVNGDVSKPGEYAFRPFMTVRQAVAMSGGYDLLRMRTTNPYLESADVKSDYQSLWAELVREQARVWRIKTELGDKDTTDRDAMKNAPLPMSTISQILGVAAQQLAVSRADHQRQKAFLQRSIKEGQQQIEILSEQQKKEEEGTRADSEELQKVLDLYGKGALPSPRVTDARRAVLLSSTRKLQTMVQLMQMQRQQDELQRQLEKLDDQHKIDLLRELQEASGRVGSLQAKLQGATEKLQYTTARSQLVRGQELKPSIAVIRKEEKGRERFTVDEETELQPGDVVEVTLRSQQSEASMTAPNQEARTDTFPAQRESQAAASMTGKTIPMQSGEQQGVSAGIAETNQDEPPTALASGDVLLPRLSPHTGRTLAPNETRREPPQRTP